MYAYSPGKTNHNCRNMFYVEERSFLSYQENSVLCGKGFDETAKATQVLEKGLATLKRICRERNLDSLQSGLIELQNSEKRMQVHHSYRRKLVDPHQKPSAEPAKKKLRSNSSKFDWKNFCFFYL